MDYQLKGLILNHTLKSFAITPIESANVLKVTMKFYGDYKYKSPSKRRRDMLRKKRFLAKFRKDPVLVPVPFLEPGQSPHPVSLGGPVLATMEASLLKQVHEIEEQIRGFHERWDRLAKEAEQAEKEQEKVSNWVRDLLDQRVDLRVEIGSMELELEQLKEERDRMQREISGLGGAHQVAASSVSGKSQGASAGPRATKKKKAKQKRHPGLPSQERQEYYKSYLANL